jgi:hypothetical protein
MGGGSGASIAGAAKSAKGIAEIMGKLGVQARGMAEQVDTKVGAATDMIAQRKLELQMVRQSKLEARAEQLRKAGGQNLAAGVAALAKSKEKGEGFDFGTFGRMNQVAGGGTLPAMEPPTINPLSFLDDSQMVID